jgi:hypothetical protein
MDISIVWRFQIDIIIPFLECLIMLKEW